MNATVASVNSEPRMWESKHGPMASLTVTFEDGQKGQLNCKPDNFEERVKAFQALIGAQVTVEDGGKFEDGNPKPLKITDYPGKPQPSGGGRQGGGGRGFTPDPLRYAVEAAVSLAQTAWRIPDGATEYRTGPQAQGAFDKMLDAVEQAIPRILKASAATPPQGNPQTAAEKETHESPKPTGAGEDPSSPETHSTPVPDGPPKTYKFAPDKCPHQNLKDAPREGFKMCEDCGRAGPARQFEKQEQLA